MSIWKVKVGHLTTLSDCPYPSFWPEIWKWKDQKSMMDVLALYILYKLNSKMEKKTLGIQLKQWLLWAQVSEFYILLRLAITLIVLSFH